jgi:hypothetical protein
MNDPTSLGLTSLTEIGAMISIGVVPAFAMGTAATVAAVPIFVAGAAIAAYGMYHTVRECSN